MKAAAFVIVKAACIIIKWVIKHSGVLNSTLKLGQKKHRRFSNKWFWLTYFRQQPAIYFQVLVWSVHSWHPCSRLSHTSSLFGSCVLSAFGSLFEVYITYTHVPHSLTYPLSPQQLCLVGFGVLDAHVAHSLLYSAIFFGFSKIQHFMESFELHFHPISPPALRFWLAYAKQPVPCVCPR
jgi:hypothetical protein